MENLSEEYDDYCREFRQGYFDTIIRYSNIGYLVSHDIYDILEKACLHFVQTNYKILNSFNGHTDGIDFYCVRNDMGSNINYFRSYTDKVHEKLITYCKECGPFRLNREDNKVFINKKCVGDKYKIGMILQRNDDINSLYEIGVLSNTEVVMVSLDDKLETLVFSYDYVDRTFNKFINNGKLTLEVVDKDTLFWQEHQRKWVENNCPALDESGQPKIRPEYFYAQLKKWNEETQVKSLAYYENYFADQRAKSTKYSDLSASHIIDHDNLTRRKS